jgi:hypothetical protein
MGILAAIRREESTEAASQVTTSVERLGASCGSFGEFDKPTSERHRKARVIGSGPGPNCSGCKEAVG